MKTKAVELLREKITADGWVVETVAWLLPEPIPGCRHPYKYRLYCGRSGFCLLRYDNERGKGDHIHESGYERDYTFIDLDTLILDFRRDVRRIMEDRR